MLNYRIKLDCIWIWKIQGINGAIAFHGNISLNLSSFIKTRSEVAGYTVLRLFHPGDSSDGFSQMPLNVITKLLVDLLQLFLVLNRDKFNFTISLAGHLFNIFNPYTYSTHSNAIRNSTNVNKLNIIMVFIVSFHRIVVYIYMFNFTRTSLC